MEKVMKKIHVAVMVLMTVVASLVLSSCSDDGNEVKLYKLYNIDTGKDVPVYTSYNNHHGEEAQYVPSRSDCTTVNASESEDEATTAIKLAGRTDTLYVQGKYLFAKTVDGPSKIEEMYGKNRYMDMILDKVRQLQDSHLHYTSSPFMLKIKLGVVFLLFFIAAIYMIGGFEEANGKDDDAATIVDNRTEWYKCLPAMLLGMLLIYYEFVDVIVMGDGYFRAIESGPAFLDFKSLGWFLNLVLTLVIGLIYLIFAVLVSLLLMFLQVIVVPIIGVSMTGLSRNSLIGNVILCILAISGFGTGYLTGSDTILFITLAVCGCCVLALIWAGYSTGYYQAILALLLPLMYIVTLVSIGFLAKFFISVSLILAVFLLVLGVMGTSSKFQSQGSGDGSAGTADSTIYDDSGNIHHVSSADGDFVNTTDGRRYRSRADGTYEKI